MKLINKQEIFNYSNVKKKWKGIIEYRVLVYVCIYTFIIWKFVSILSLNFSFSLIVFSILMIPVFILLLFSIKQDNVIEIIIYVVLFYLKNKIYIKTNTYCKQGNIYVKK